MVTASVMTGMGVVGRRLTPPMALKLMVSAPGVKLACWMAALSVHSPLEVLHKASALLASDSSPCWELTTKVVEAWAGAEASIPAAIIAATTSPAASAFAFLLHTNPSLLICVLIALCFLPFRLAAYVQFCSLAH